MDCSPPGSSEIENHEQTKCNLSLLFKNLHWERTEYEEWGKGREDKFPSLSENCKQLTGNAEGENI